MYRSRLVFALAMAALAAILVPSSLPAQITFDRTYGGTGVEGGNSVQQTADGGYIIAGYTTSFGAGSGDVYLIKTDANGDTLWTRAYGGANRDNGCWVQQTRDSGYIMVGYTDSHGAGSDDVYIIKTDANGDTLWTKTYGGTDVDRALSGQQTTDGGYIVAGFTNSFGAGACDFYLVKTDAAGDTLWTRTYEGAGGDWGQSVQQTTDTGYIIAGFTQPPGAGYRDVYLIKTNAVGDALWTGTFGGAQEDLGYSIQQTADGGYIITGLTDSFGAGGGDVYLIKTDANGDTIWARTFGGTGWDQGWSIGQTADSGFVIVGHTESFGAGYRDVYLIKTDARGDTLWTRTFGGTHWDIGYSVQQTADGGYIIAGETWSFGAGGCDVWLIKTDSLGNVAVAEPKASPTRASNLTIACQPNPATGAATVRLSPFASRHSPFALHVYDAQGCLVHSVLGIRASSFPLDLRALPSGAYFIRCDVAGQHASARVILQR